MGSNFKVKIDPYVIAKVDDIDYYYFEKFGNFEMGILLTKELKDVKETIQDNPYIGTLPRYAVLKRQGYRVLILEKNLAFYKVNEEKKEVVIYAFVDQRQDYLNIIRGL